MIYTVTLHPAIDHTVVVEKITKNKKYTVLDSLKQAAGKGINVSKVLKQFSVTSTVLTVLGGTNGNYIVNEHYELDIPLLYVPIVANTRVNLKLVQREPFKVKEENTKGDFCEENVQNQLIELVDKHIKKEDIVIFSGSILQGLSSDIYNMLITLCKAKGARTILDTSGLPLQKGIEAKPHLVKPNIDELTQLFNKKITSLEDVRNNAIELLEKGVSEVIVTLGENGTLYVSNKHVYYVKPIEVDVKNTVGAGDSFLAGYVYGLDQKLSVLECLKYATAVATISITEQGTGVENIKSMDLYINKVMIEEIF